MCYPRLFPHGICSSAQGISTRYIKCYPRYIIMVCVISFGGRTVGNTLYTVGDTMIILWVRGYIPWATFIGGCTVGNTLYTVGDTMIILWVRGYIPWATSIGGHTLGNTLYTVGATMYTPWVLHTTCIRHLFQSL